MKSNRDSLPECFENLKPNEFIHGMLILDPMRGFLREDRLGPDRKFVRDSYVWLLNMLSWYSDAKNEPRLNDLDFLMHEYLRNGTKGLQKNKTSNAGVMSDNSKVSKD